MLEEKLQIPLGNPLAGANVVVDDSELGAAADEDGKFNIEGVQAGSSITASAIGYEDLTLFADQAELNFELVSAAIEMSALEVLASRAGEKTAVAYTDVTKEELALRLGSQDIPLAMNLVPSVYATNQGGGAGDARINVRGFNQRNVAIMVNGIPVNDMENGWVYWSNWDGMADVTSSIQMQKGLKCSKPSYSFHRRKYEYHHRCCCIRKRWVIQARIRSMGIPQIYIEL